MAVRQIDNSPDYETGNDSPTPQGVIGSWVPIDLSAVLRGESVGIKPTVLSRDDGVMLFYPACLNSLLGESESCKTWVALTAIEQELNLGHNVLFIDFEGAAQSIVERLQNLGVSEQQIKEQFFYSQPGVTFNELQQDDLAGFIIDHGSPSLVIIDGITEAMSQAALNPDVGTDVVKFYDGAPRWFARFYGSAVVMIDHVTKSKETRGRFAIGSERKISGIDGAAYMVHLVAPFGRGKTGKVKLTVSKDRGGYVRQFTSSGDVIAFIELKSSNDGSISTTITPAKEYGSAPFVPTHIMERISKIVEVDPDGVGVLQLRSALGGNNDVTALAIELLIKDEYIEFTKGPKNKHLHTSLKPYREPVEGGDYESF